MSKKIAIIDPVGKKAGMDYYNLGLLENLSKLDIKTYLFSNNLKVKSSINNYPYFDSFVDNKILKALKLIKGYIRAFSVCKKEKVDYIIMHVFSVQIIYFLFFVIAKFFRLKIITISHDVTSLANDDNITLKKWLYKYLSKYIVVHNNYSLIQFEKIMGKTTKCNVIKHGSYTNVIDNSISVKKAKEKLGFSNKKKYVLFFGQIKEAKRLDILIESFQYVQSDAELIIAGRLWKDNFSKYDQRINSLGLNNRVHKYIRFIPDKERELFFKACDIMVLPYEEVYQSGVLLMGMSYGKAMVVSDLSPFKEVINNNVNGLIFKSLDSKDLGDKLNFLLNNNEKLKIIQKGAIESINNEFSWFNIAKDYKNKFNL